MTFILALGNANQVIQIADRRLTVNGRLYDDESSKAGVFICANARLAFGFTGLARFQGFETQGWLRSALVDCAAPDYQASSILERLKERATRDFQTLPALRHIPRSNKRLSVMFSGYLYHHSPPLATFAILTNCQDVSSGTADFAWDHFECTYWSEQRPIDNEMSLVQRIGFWPAMNNQDVAVLRMLLIERKPAEAILGKAIEVLHTIADRSQAHGTIGKQLLSIILPRDANIPVKTGYHSNIVTHKVFIPDMVVAINAQERSTVSRAYVEPVDPSNTPPMAVPKVSRNAPCPCKSGRKYKRCHGLRGVLPK